VTGSQGNFLRQVEEEWGTLMFFADFRGRGERQEGDMEKLAIFGNQRARRGAQLKVMAAVETKMPGYFTTNVKEGDDNPTGFGTHNLVLKPEDLSYALGKKGMTRKKLARSSGCIVEYVGYTVFMSGMPDERKRAKLQDAVIEKTLSGLAWSVVVALGLAVWTYLKASIKGV
jgi:hypothetical protein